MISNYFLRVYIVEQEKLNNKHNGLSVSLAEVFRAYSNLGFFSILHDIPALLHRAFSVFCWIHKERRKKWIDENNGMRCVSNSQPASQTHFTVVEINETNCVIPKLVYGSSFEQIILILMMHQKHQITPFSKWFSMFNHPYTFDSVINTESTKRWRSDVGMLWR